MCFVVDFLVMDWSPTWIMRVGVRDVEYWTQLSIASKHLSGKGKLGEKLQTGMQKYSLFIKVPENLIRKKVKKTRKLNFGGKLSSAHRHLQAKFCKQNFSYLQTSYIKQIDFVCHISWSVYIGEYIYWSRWCVQMDLTLPVWLIFLQGTMMAFQWI